MTHSEAESKRISFLSVFSSLTAGGIAPNDAETTAYGIVNKLFATYIEPVNTSPSASFSPPANAFVQPTQSRPLKKQWISGTCRGCQNTFNSQGKYDLCFNCNQAKRNDAPPF